MNTEVTIGSRWQGEDGRRAIEAAEPATRTPETPAYGNRLGSIPGGRVL